MIKNCYLKIKNIVLLPISIISVCIIFRTNIFNFINQVIVNMGILTLIAFIILIICCVCYGYKLYSNLIKHRHKLLRNIYNIYFSIVFLVTFIYLIVNWEDAISFTFFHDFNGNNLLFVCFVIFIILTLFYEIDFNGLKFKPKIPKIDEKTLGKFHNKAESDILEKLEKNLGTFEVESSDVKKINNEQK